VVVDSVVVALQAGLQLREVWGDVVRHAPPALRREIAVLARDIDATGDIARALRSLRRRLGDPTTARVVEALLLGLDTGQAEQLARLLAGELRPDASAGARAAQAHVWFRVLLGAVALGPWVVSALPSGNVVTAARPATWTVVGLAVSAAVTVMGGRAVPGRAAPGRTG